MGIDKAGNVMSTGGTVPAFGAAADGDADRNVSKTKEILNVKFWTQVCIKII